MAWTRTFLAPTSTEGRTPPPDTQEARQLPRELRPPGRRVRQRQRVLRGRDLAVRGGRGQGEVLALVRRRPSLDKTGLIRAGDPGAAPRLGHPPVISAAQRSRCTA
jgi:hypothetical protein